MLYVISAHAKDVTETLEEFDDEFNIVEAPNLSDEDIAAEKAALKEAEDEINQVNNDADSPFKEALNEFSDLPGEEFLKEKTGVIRTGMVTYVPNYLFSTFSVTIMSQELIEIHYLKI